VIEKTRNGGLNVSISSNSGPILDRCHRGTDVDRRIGFSQRRFQFCQSYNAWLPGVLGAELPKGSLAPSILRRYISGIAYMIEDSCIPFGSVTQDQMVRVVVQYIDSRPTRMHEAFGKLALEAMRDGWPCKR
jgi:Rap1a immunity proteins